MSEIKHILRYGTNADQKYFDGDFESCYNTVAINANMIASSPNTLALFVGKKTINKPFFIDPISHLFQHSQSYISGASGGIKRSIDNLISSYVKDIIEDELDTQEKYDFVKSIIKSDNITDEFITDFTRNILSYQENLVSNGNKSIADYTKYVDFAKEEDPSQKDLQIHQKPEFLVAPYFYIDEESWLEKNILFLEKAKSLASDDQKVFAQIVISKRVFDKGLLNTNDLLDKIIEKYKNSSADGFLLWVDDHSEHEEISESLQKYKGIIEGLYSDEKPVYSLYGGFFSICLSNKELKALSGVSHGMEYGESREVVPVGGGIPVAKYYFYPLHKRMNLKDMVDVIRQLKIETKEQFFEKICDCPMCKEVIKSDVLNDFQEGYGKSKPSTFQRGETLVTMSFSTTETKARSLKHYLYSKKREFAEVENKTINDIVDRLNKDYEKYKNIVDINNCQQLEEWAQALSSNKEE